MQLRLSLFCVELTASCMALTGQIDSLRYSLRVGSDFIIEDVGVLVGGTYQATGCFSVGTGGPTGTRAVLGGCWDTAESQRLETAAGSLVRCGLQELWEK